jgi:hypothetical protein
MTVTELPTDIKFGKVAARFLLAVGDSGDAGSEPDAQPAAGHVKFLPRQPNQRSNAAGGALVTSRPPLCELDEDGYLVDAQGNQGVWLLEGAYDVTFNIKGVRLAPLTIEVTEDHTDGSPLVLTLLVPPGGPVATPNQYSELSARIGVVELGITSYAATPAQVAAAKAEAIAVANTKVASGGSEMAGKADTGVPVWGTGWKSFDRERGLYNFSARTLPRFRKAKANAVAGLAQLHISVIGDSTSHLADYTTPQAQSTWSAKMRDTLMRTLGLQVGGSGFLSMWTEAFTDEVSNTPAWEPRLAFHAGAGGSITHLNSFGTFGYNAVQLFTNVDKGEVVFTPGEYADEFWVYMLGSGYHTLVTVWGGAGGTQFEIGGYPGEVFTPGGGWTAIDPQPGYVRHDNPAAGGGLVVARLPVARQNNWSAYIRSPAPGVSYLAGVESRDTTVAGGLRVSNLSEGGRSMNDIFTANNEVSGYGGMPFALDAQKAHLAIIALGMNDWQGHLDKATFKARLKTVVARQRSTAATGTFGHGVGAGGDALLWISAQPDFANHPPDHIQVPAWEDFMRTVYEVADEDDVALVDEAYRWKDYATSSALMRDFIHPNRVGHADQGVALGSALASV